MRVAITGGTGFIGRQLVSELDTSGDEYLIVTRDRRQAREQFPKALEILEWAPPGRGLPGNALEGVDGIVHMAGATVAKRWTSRRKRAIENSRVDSTRSLVDTLQETGNRPPVLVSFSAIGFYGPCDDTPLDEDAPPGSDFLAQVCQRWERESARATSLGMRVVNPRVGIVIGRGGGALDQMLLPFRLGVGGPIGHGRQWMSWIHVSDVVGLTLESLRNSSLSGPLNATAPEPVTNRAFSKALGRALHRPAVLPIPVLGLRLMFGGLADILATGQRVRPSKALRAGYAFRFQDLDQALAEAVS